MKLIMSIVSTDDAGKLIEALNKKEFSVTRLATTGGFLRAGNTTLIIGVENERLEEALKIIKDECSTRSQIITTTQGPIGNVLPFPIEIEVGGATVFVLDVERFEKL